MAPLHFADRVVEGPLGSDLRLEKDLRAVELEFSHARLDVLHRAVLAALGWTVDPDLRIPTFGELLDRRDVDRSIVQVVLDVRQVLGKETSVGSDRISAERNRSRLRDMQLDEVQCLCASLFE